MSATEKKAPLLEIRGLTKEFRQGKDRVLAVNHIDLDIQKGEVFGLVGESGCGKSTFGQMLVHLLDPSGGKILLNGRDITRRPAGSARICASRCRLSSRTPTPLSTPTRPSAAH